MPEGEYGFYLLDSILKNTPMSNPKGLAKKQHLCIKCSQPLDVDHLQPQQFQVSLGWKDAKPFSAILDGPSATCGSCMTMQMLKTREVERDEIPGAIANAFDSIGLKR
jgi:hypothetical protein